jgi:hypothetical protein
LTRIGRAFFGAHAQVAIGALAFLVGLAAWLWWSFVEPPTVESVFHVSMFYGQVACYAIIATGLGYRAAERIEEQVGDG